MDPLGSLIKGILEGLGSPAEVLNDLVAIDPMYQPPDLLTTDLRTHIGFL